MALGEPETLAAHSLEWRLMVHDGRAICRAAQTPGAEPVADSRQA